MPSYIRRRQIVAAVKIETTPGVDAFGGATPSAASDFLKTDIEIAFNQQQIDNPEQTGSLDKSAPIPGGTKVQLTMTFPLRGSGVAGTAPRWGRLMQACAYQEVNSAAIAASAATAGTTSSVTLGAGYSATLQVYRGMPAVLTGNPAAATPTLITDYAAGKVAKLAQLFGTALSASTLVAIPANTLYAPTSDLTVVKNATVLVYTDGIAWLITGCAGTWSLDLTAGGTGMLKFVLSGQYNGPVAASAPAGIVFDSPTLQPPIWRGGISRMGGVLARASKLSVEGGCTPFEPENPEAVEGFDPSIITGRDSKGTIDPLMSVTDTIARMASFKGGAQTPLAAALGSMPGNSFGITIPAAQYTGITPQNRSDLMAESVAFDCNGSDAGLFLAAY